MLIRDDDILSHMHIMLMCQSCLCSPVSFLFTAEAAGGGESREMAEDGQEVG